MQGQGKAYKNRNDGSLKMVIWESCYFKKGGDPACDIFGSESESHVVRKEQIEQNRMPQAARSSMISERLTKVKIAPRHISCPYVGIEPSASWKTDKSKHT